jgi:hypothetical protein
VNESAEQEPIPQGLATEEFFYFFLRLRKGEVRRTVQGLRARYPDEGPEQLARRLINSKTGLSVLGGTLLYAPALVPTAGQVIKLLGLVGAASVLTRMHLYLILEIAHLFGRDIDDTARVPEMIAVVGATGLGASAPMLVQLLGLQPLYAIPAGAASMAAVTQLVGTAAVLYYRSAEEAAEGPGSEPGAEMAESVTP